MAASTPERSGLAVALEQQPLEVIAPPGAMAKTCHQCRQKRTDFWAACKQATKRGLCTIKYCKKCLLNRYGQKAEDETAENEEKNKQWICPKCRGICNCSLCMNKRGEAPTGMMAHIAKASGCTSVHDLLLKGPEAVAAAQTMRKANARDKQGTKRAREIDTAADETVVERDENPVDGGDNGEPLPRADAAAANNIVLPSGTPLHSIAGVELDEEFVGSAIQLNEFCHAFAEFFQIRKGQPEKILQDIVGGHELRLVSSHVAEFHINLLCVIQEGMGKKPPAYTRDGDAWIIDVGKYISESTFLSKELPPICLNHGVSGYKNLSPSSKLCILNFLCDEALSTDKLRTWMNRQIEVAAEPMNATKEKVRAAKKKVKELKERLKNSMDKTKLVPNEVATLVTEEHKDLISHIKEAQEVQRAALNDMATIDQKGDLISTKPLMVEKGLAYWKLAGYSDNTSILLQEYGDAELTGNKDKWFMFTEDEEKVIEEHIATRSRRQTRKRLRV